MGVGRHVPRKAILLNSKKRRNNNGKKNSFSNISGNLLCAYRGYEAADRQLSDKGRRDNRPISSRGRNRPRGKAAGRESQADARTGIYGD